MPRKKYHSITAGKDFGTKYTGRGFQSDTVELAQEAVERSQRLAGKSTLPPGPRSELKYRIGDQIEQIATLAAALANPALCVDLDVLTKRLVSLASSLRKSTKSSWYQYQVVLEKMRLAELTVNKPEDTE